MKPHVVIAGYGYWGPNLVRNFIKHPLCGNVGLCETHASKAVRGKQEFPSIKLYGSFEEALSSPEVDAIVLATPVSTHFDLAKKVLQARKHVLVEKPMAVSLAEASELLELAHKNEKVLMADHTFVYHPAVQKIKEIIESGILGKLHYIDSTRINLGIFQHDVNVFWDLAVHDVSIINFLTGQMPRTIQAIGASHTGNEIENIGYLIMHYDSGLLVHINCSWISPVKLRHTLIGGEKKMVVYNDLDSNEPVKIYDAGFAAKNAEDMKQLLYECRMGDVYSPRIPSKEALEGVANDFLESILENKTPISDGVFALDVIIILEAAQKSIKNNGERMLLERIGDYERVERY